MELALANGLCKERAFGSTSEVSVRLQNLSQAAINTPCIIKRIAAADQELADFLFTLGCYEGETVTVISRLADNYVINVKDARYSIDDNLAKAILI